MAPNTNNPPLHPTGDSVLGPGVVSYSQARATGFFGRWNGVHVMAGLFIAGVVVTVLASKISSPSFVVADMRRDESPAASLRRITSWPQGREDEAVLVAGVLQGQRPVTQTATPGFARNPFASEADPTPPAGAVTTAPATPTSSPSPDAERLARMTKAAEQLRLNSVLVGSHGPAAIVSGRLVQQDQEIDGWVVKEILPTEVTLVWEGHTHKLVMR